MANNKTNKLVVPQASKAMEKMKLEIAQELGLEDYDNMDKGSLPSRVNGMVGGTMTKRLIEMAQKQMANENINQTNLDFQEYQNEAKQDIQNSKQYH